MNKEHIKALIKKEFHQILADKSVFIVAFFIPLVLVFIYGSGLRMDIKPVPVVIVSSQQDDIIAKEVYFNLAGSKYFKVFMVNNTIDSQKLLQKHEVNAEIILPNNLMQGMYKAPVQIVLGINGVETQLASLTQAYLTNVLSNIIANKNLTRQLSYLIQVNGKTVMQYGTAQPVSYKDITITSRNWFNEGNNSTWYLMAGQLIGVVTLMAAFMSSIVIAREFERGTMDGLLATNTTALEFLISKIVPYYILTLLGAFVSILVAFCAYQLPFRGNIIFYVLTMLIYLYVAVMLGLLISVATKNQFLSSEYAIILAFLPSILLSGALFDTRSIPSVITFITKLFPPTYAVTSSKICILSGGSENILSFNLLVLLGFAILFTGITYLLLHKQFKRFKPNQA